MRSALPASELRPIVLGLNLVRLLVSNRIADFHIELETLPPEDQAHACIAFPKQLEQALMEGTYRQVLAAGASAPSPHMTPLLTQLAATVRDELAGCASAVRLSYPCLFCSVSGASQCGVCQEHMRVQLQPPWVYMRPLEHWMLSYIGWVGCDSGVLVYVVGLRCNRFLVWSSAWSYLSHCRLPCNCTIAILARLCVLRYKTRSRCSQP